MLRDAGSIPPGLPGVFVVTGPPAGCATGTGGAAQRIYCVAPVLLALVGQSGISSRIGCSSANPSFTEAVVWTKRSVRVSGWPDKVSPFSFLLIGCSCCAQAVGVPKRSVRASGWGALSSQSVRNDAPRQ